MRKAIVLISNRVIYYIWHAAEEEINRVIGRDWRNSVTREYMYKGQAGARPGDWKKIETVVQSKPQLLHVSIKQIDIPDGLWHPN